MANGMSKLSETKAALTTFHPPNIITEWKVSLALLLTFKRRSARRALKAPTARDPLPGLVSEVKTLAHNVTSTIPSMKPHELWK
jgi:hypothetical protein